MRLFTLPFVLFLAACAAPGQQQAVGDQAAQEEADIQAIKDCLVAWDKGNLAGDADAQMALVTDDYIRMDENKPAIVGKEAVRSSFQEFYEKNSWENAENRAVEIRLAGDWAYVRGTFTGTFVPKAGGEPTQAIAKVIGIWEREPDGSWKLSRSCANSDLALPEPRD